MLIPMYRDFFYGKRMKKAEDFRVINHRWLNYKTFIIELEAAEKLLPVEAGNFAEIRIDNSPNVFLRRPFSVFDYNEGANTISFFIKVIGEGTRLIGETRKGDHLNLLYPLGNSFTPVSKKKVLIIAGGSGVAPFLILGRKLRSLGNDITFLFGGRNAEDIILADHFEELGTVMATTEDGTFGEKGLVTQHSIMKTAGTDFGQVYTCGPEPMMKAVAKWSSERRIPCQVSLENTMACGFGACLCCIVPTVDGNQCVCTEGPVFNTNHLEWQI